MANNPPVVTILAGSSYAAGTVLTGTQLFSASDPQGSSDIDYIKVFDNVQENGAVWRYNGSVITPGGAAAGGFQFEYANRGLLTYMVGTGSNAFVIEAFDNAGADSNDATLTITGTSADTIPGDASTTVNGTHGQWLPGKIDATGLDGLTGDKDYYKVILAGGYLYRFEGDSGVSASDTLNAMVIRRDGSGNLLPVDKAASGADAKAAHSSIGDG